jgi:hypothetical protein
MICWYWELDTGQIRHSMTVLVVGNISFEVEVANFFFFSFPSLHPLGLLSPVTLPSFDTSKAI